MLSPRLINKFKHSTSFSWMSFWQTNILSSQYKNTLVNQSYIDNTLFGPNLCQTIFGQDIVILKNFTFYFINYKFSEKCMSKTNHK